MTTPEQGDNELGAAAMARHLAAMQMREAIASVALSHRPDCTCDVCRAAQGDDDAMMRVTMWMMGSRS